MSNSARDELRGTIDSHWMLYPSLTGAQSGRRPPFTSMATALTNMGVTEMMMPHIQLPRSSPGSPAAIRCLPRQVDASSIWRVARGHGSARSTLLAASSRCRVAARRCQQGPTAWGMEIVRSIEKRMHVRQRCRTSRCLHGTGCPVPTSHIAPVPTPHAHPQAHPTAHATLCMRAKPSGQSCHGAAPGPWDAWRRPGDACGTVLYNSIVNE